MEKRLYVAQRLSAAMLAPLVLIHLGLIVYAVEGGLSAAEILDRTRGHIGWALFYLLFVIAAAIHAPIGLRNVLKEWTTLKPRWIDILMILLSALLFILGLRAVAAVF